MKTPIELLLHETPDYTFFKVFGCACWPHLRPYNHRKLEFRSKKCVFLGYSSLHKGYKCLHVPTNRVYISRDVVFDENVFPFSSMPQQPSTPPSMHSSPLMLGQFEDVAYSPVLLPNHGAGVGRGARLELLSDTTPVAHVDRSVHMHAPVVDPASGAVPVHATGPALVSDTGPVSSEDRPRQSGRGPCRMKRGPPHRRPLWDGFSGLRLRQRLHVRPRLRHHPPVHPCRPLRLGRPDLLTPRPSLRLGFRRPISRHPPLCWHRRLLFSLHRNARIHAAAVEFSNPSSVMMVLSHIWLPVLLILLQIPLMNHATMRLL